MQKKTLLAIEVVLSIAAIAAILYFVGAQQVISSLSRANLFFLLLAAFFYLLQGVLMAVRINLLLENLNERLPLKKVISSHFAGMLASDFTPARTGYFTTAFALNINHKVSLDKAMVAILGPQMLDFIFKVAVGSLAVLFIIYSVGGFANNPQNMLGIVVGLAAIAFMVLIGLLTLFSKKFLGFISKFVLFPVFGKYVQKLVIFVNQIQDSSFVVVEKLPQLLLLLAGLWVMKALEWYCYGIALGLNVNTTLPLIIFFAFLQPLIVMLQFVPTPTVAGAGVSEAGLALVLPLFLVPVPLAVAYGLVARFVPLLIDLVGVREAVSAISPRS
ncbi:Lysylphosphatidylglycerol synthase TM region [Candidatus Gugararchaeum adminiculabundum]|nr:Lysylphosphatidylglycerol synthase TM region [Candidatus Gugararchaeum adminiculabundum]